MGQELGQRLLAQLAAQPSPGVCLLVAGLVLGGTAGAGSGGTARAGSGGWTGLCFGVQQDWPGLGFRHTDADGRCQLLLAPGQVKSGTYKLHFETAEYWKGQGQTSFYPFVEVWSVGRLGQVTHKV